MLRYIILFSILLLPLAADAQNRAFQSSWEAASEDHMGVGPDFWTSEMQDWRVSNGRLELLDNRKNGPLQTVYLLTRHVDGENTGFNMDIVTGAIDRGRMPARGAYTGFLIGARIDSLDAADPAAGGIIAGVDGSGRAFFRDMNDPDAPELGESTPGRGVLPDSVALRLLADRRPAGMRLTLLVTDVATGKEVSRAVLDQLDPMRIDGGLALVSNPGPTATRFWFTDWYVDGPSIQPRADQAAEK